jgi:hypothetical protein
MSTSVATPPRSSDLQRFLDAAEAAYDAAARDERSRMSLARIFEALRTPAPAGNIPPERLPACAVLPEALRIESPDPVLANLAACFATLEPSIGWKHRAAYGDTYDDRFYAGHANGMICGPGGVEQRTDLWIGATVMTPQTRYPDHDHSPEEVYLVLTPGEFSQDRGPWFSPGVGGSFYNPPGITHAMRAVDRPFFAVWALWIGT